MKLSRLTIVLAALMGALSACGSKTDLIAPASLDEPVAETTTVKEPKKPGILLD